MSAGAAGAAGLGLGQQWANNPNLSAPGWVQNGLSTLDPLGNQITKMGGDPLNLYGNKNNSNALLFPSSNNSAGSSNSPTSFPNLGASTLNPIMPSGTWGPATQGSGAFNAMANQAAGQLYTPTGIQNTPTSTTQTSQGTGPIGSKPASGTMYSPNALPGGGGNPALGSPAGSALSKSQIHGGNVGPTGVTEPSDPAFLSQLHNGMMAAVKAQYGGNPASGGQSASTGNLISLNPYTSHIGLDPIATGTGTPFTGNSGTVPLTGINLPSPLTQILSATNPLLNSSISTAALSKAPIVLPNSKTLSSPYQKISTRKSL